jgi:RNA-directed DNA polymerase
MNIRELEQLARHLHVSPSEIARVISRLDRSYRVKRIPKKSGGERHLHIPVGELRTLQDKIQKNIFQGLDMPAELHGGVRGRSYLTNAKQHVGKKIVMKLDIRDFFPSIRPEKVRAVFERLGFEGEAARVLTRVTTYKQQLPQGAPTSPAIANLVLLRADARIRGLAKQHGLSSTRFVDDIVVSGGYRVPKFARLVERILAEEGFRIKGGGAVIMEQSVPQLVTGVTVNWKVNVPRHKRLAITQEASRNLKFGVKPTDRLRGKLGYVTSANKNSGKRIAARFKQQSDETCKNSFVRP